MWMCDSIVDFVNDYIPNLVKIVFFEKRLDETGQKDYCDHLSKMITYLSKKLEHGKDFLVGDKITIADFHVASIIFAHVFNDNYAGGAAFTDKGKAIVAEHEVFAKYCERMQHQLKEHLETRAAAPI